MSDTNWTLDGAPTGETGGFFVWPSGVTAGTVLRRGGFLAGTIPTLPVITGPATNMPGDVLTSTVAHQWYANNVAIAGEAGTSYTLRLADAGKTIGQRVPSQDRVVRLASSLPGLNGYFSARAGLLDGSGNPAANGAALATWQDLSGGAHHAAQTTAGFRPAYNNAGAFPFVQFDGTDDFLELTGGSLANFRNKAHGIMILALSDTNRSGGSSTHYAMQYTTPSGGTNSRIALATRSGGDNFRAQGKTLDADAGVSSASVASADGFFVLTCKIDWNLGRLRLRKDSLQPGLDVTLTTAGNTSDTDSATATIGKGSTLLAAYQIACIITAAPSSEWSAADLAYAERLAGQHIGKANF